MIHASGKITISAAIANGKAGINTISVNNTNAYVPSPSCLTEIAYRIVSIRLQKQPVALNIFPSSFLWFMFLCIDTLWCREGRSKPFSDVLFEKRYAYPLAPLLALGTKRTPFIFRIVAPINFSPALSAFFCSGVARWQYLRRSRKCSASCSHKTSISSSEGSGIFFTFPRENEVRKHPVSFCFFVCLFVGLLGVFQHQYNRV